MSEIPLAIVVAVGRNGAIGRNGHLPWRMPSDLARFKALTMGKPMIMGRRTFESIGRALPGRESIVVTGGGTELPTGVHRAESPTAALALGRERADAMRAEEISLIGGAALFADMMGDVRYLYVTRVDLSPPADTFFPQIAFSEWREVSRHCPEPHPDDEAACSFIDYVRR